jgi:glycosyltransferase involved in cell wall biosynthesis
VPIRFEHPIAPGVYVGGSPVEVDHVLASRRALHDVDVIHDHTAVGPLLGLVDKSLPVVATNHNPFAPPFSSLFERVSEEVAVVAISEHHAGSATGVKISRVIHHGLDPDVYPFGDGSGGYVLFLGRMSPEKGPHRAIEIARALGVPIVLAGKQQASAELAYFEEQVRPRLGNNVDYVGEVGFAAKLELLAGAAALLSPITWDEPFGMVMLEALACGTPVLSFDRGAAPEIVEDGVTGFLGDNEGDLVDAFSRLGEINRGRCRAAVEGHFSLSRMVAEHVDLYRSVIEEHRAGAV